jgi:hypothetical protein
MPLSPDIERERLNRARFLKLLFEKSGGDEYKWISMWNLGTELGLDKETTSRITQYLDGEHLLVYRALGGTIGITHWGIKEMEQAISNPNVRTQHFPPLVNIIQVSGNIAGSQIQQGTQASQQVQIGEDTQHALSEFLTRLIASLVDIKPKDDEFLDLKADVQSIMAQISAAHPKRSIIIEALSSIKTVLEEAGAIVLAAEAAKLLMTLGL